MKSFNCVKIIKRFKRIRAFVELKQKYELKHNLLNDCFILVQLDGVNFKKFTSDFNKPVDQRLVNLMNQCTKEMFESLGCDLLCSYGFSDEVNFLIDKRSSLFERKFK
jgi:tRNA(His) 5'-end guanylyltransferase